MADTYESSIKEKDSQARAIHSQRTECNLPIQSSRKIINFAENFNILNKITQSKPYAVNQDNRGVSQIPNIASNITILDEDRAGSKLRDHSDRSNSIKGRKLSICDAKLTVSKNTLETIDQQSFTEREKETLLRLSVIGIAPNSVEPSNFLTAQILQENKSLKPKVQNKSPKLSKPSQQDLKIKSQQKSSKITLKLNSKPKNVQFAQKIYTQKSAAKQDANTYQDLKGKQSQSHSFLLTFSKKDKDISPLQAQNHFDKPRQQIIKNKENQYQAAEIEESLERKKNKQILQESQIHFSNYAPKQILQGEILKENRIKRLEEEGEKIKRSFLKQNSSGKKLRPRTSLNYESENSGSPVRNQKLVGEAKNTNWQRYNQRSSLSEEKNGGGRRSEGRSVDRIIKENLKKHSQKRKNQIQQQLSKEIQRNLKAQLVKKNNALIRNQNLNSVTLKEANETRPVSLLDKRAKSNYRKGLINQTDIHHKSHQVLQNESSLIERERSKSGLRNGLELIKETKNEIQSLQMKSKSPLKQFNIMKNKDMPLKIQNDENHQKQKLKKKYDLGLDIFELKKELGMYGQDKQMQSIEQIITERQKQKKLKKQQKLQQASQQEIIEQQMRQKYQENPQLQKLIQKQQKKWLKEQKKQKIMDMISQQKVLANLKALNQIAETKRMKKKLKVQQSQDQSNPISNINAGVHFKTLQDQSSLVHQDQFITQVHHNKSTK